ncbi:MAG: acyl-CoA/acyl-ACP dehydrogenase [Deltaproteobacteria bacterium]|nr:acyl-CoA/acyl-ACP dehydrogenase [Deltaproteobacteria bacterium]MBI3294599.1 acyl-CoA/acyl-ACP dehydrogenase [Deltaproteobacteria bacterium]
MAANYFSDYPERKEQLLKYSDLKNIILPLEEAYGDKDTFKTADEGLDVFFGALDELGRFAATELRPAAEEIDRIGCELKDGEVIFPEKLLSHLARCRELGVFASPIARKYGGLNLPRATQAIAMEMFAQACPNSALAICAYTMGDWIQLWGTEQQRSEYLPKIISHTATTSMALTEPGAGSDLGKLRSTGRKEGDHYVVNGTKRFISYGQSDLVFALVRTDPASQGLEGLSVLVVPREVNGKRNVQVTKIEDKLCLHASPTCELQFENSTGYLLGPEGQGFKVMAELMNTARLAMGALSIGICVSAIDEAKKYGSSRVTMGKPIIQHPMIADLIFEAEVEVRAMRALVIETACAFDWMNIYRARNDKMNFDRWKLRYRRLTPLAKYYCSEKAITIARNMLQIYGGYGVCTDYPAERLLRETVIYPIYEGTSQIQSLMVLKDTLKDVAKNSSGFLGSLAGAWAESMVTRSSVKQKVLQGRNELNQAIRAILMSILRDKFRSDIDALKQQKIQDFLKDFSLALFTKKTDLTMPFLWAERFTKITADYYALKCMSDHFEEGDTERERWILAFAEIAIPRMRLENHYMLNRLPLTLPYIEELKKLS